MLLTTIMASEASTFVILTTSSYLHHQSFSMNSTAILLLLTAMTSLTLAHAPLQQMQLLQQSLTGLLEVVTLKLLELIGE